MALYAHHGAVGPAVLAVEHLAGEGNAEVAGKFVIEDACLAHGGGVGHAGEAGRVADSELGLGQPCEEGEGQQEG